MDIVVKLLKCERSHSPTQHSRSGSSFSESYSPSHSPRRGKAMRWPRRLKLYRIWRRIAGLLMIPVCTLFVDVSIFKLEEYGRNRRGEVECQAPASRRIAAEGAPISNLRPPIIRFLLFTGLVGVTLLHWYTVRTTPRLRCRNESSKYGIGHKEQRRKDRTHSTTHC